MYFNSTSNDFSSEWKFFPRKDNEVVQTKFGKGTRSWKHWKLIVRQGG